MRVAAAFGFMLYLRYVPRDEKVADHYYVSIYANYVFRNKALIAATPSAPKSLTDAVWVVRKLACEYVRLFDYVISQPLLFVLHNIEKFLRGDFHSAVRMGTDNLKTLQAQNCVFALELNRLEPIVKKMLELQKFAEGLSNELSSQNRSHEDAIAACSEQVKAIMGAREAFHPEKIIEAAKKVAAYVQETLNNPEFLESLKTDDGRLARITKNLEAARCKLEQAKIQYEEKLRLLSTLMREYTALGGECFEEIKEFTRLLEYRLTISKTIMAPNGITAH